MATKILPLYSDYYYTYDVDLDSKNYTLTFRYNQRLDCYVLDILNPDEEVVIKSLPLTPFFPHLLPYSFTELTGYLCLVPYQVPNDSSLPEVSEGRDVWKTHFLVYEDL